MSPLGGQKAELVRLFGRPATFTQPTSGERGVVLGFCKIATPKGNAKLVTFGVGGGSGSSFSQRLTTDFHNFAPASAEK